MRALVLSAAVLLTIPTSIKTEHDAIHHDLVEATKAPGGAGAAAKELAKILHPHFVREEEIALPPLGLLATFASDPAAKGTPAILEMTDTLRREMPKMLEEHRQIRAAVGRLRDAALAQKASKLVELADALALHARTEEEVLYPAAILVGELIRARNR